jgi:tetratricopeptide (TPR) repeat protein
LGVVFQNQGLLEKAMNEYQEALRIYPNYARAHYNLAEILENLNRTAEALVEWEKYIWLAQNTPSQKEWIPKAQVHIEKLKNKLLQ